MGNRKIVRYNLDDLDNKNCRINLLYGERSNGKSYQLKHKKAVLNYLDTGQRFIYLRRWAEEIRTDKVEQYFNDVDVEKITDGRYNTIIVYRKAIYFATYDCETFKTARGEKIGYIMSLSQEQHSAGGSYLDVSDIIFEEFMARGSYLPDEPNKLMNLYCTVDRKRGTTRLWLVGNTISRVCPYLYEWGLMSVVQKQEQGTITITNVEGDGEQYPVAIEHIKPSGETSFTIGSHADMLNNGTWQSDPQPKLNDYKTYKLLFRIGFQFKTLKFIGELISKNDNFVWFIKPFNGEFKKNIIVISDVISVNPLYICDPYNNILPQRAQKILKTLRESNTFFATDLCGTEFKNSITFKLMK